MFTVPEQFSAATKANFDTNLAMMSALTGKECSNSEGRQLLAKTLQNFLIQNRS